VGWVEDAWAVCLRNIGCFGVTGTTLLKRLLRGGPAGVCLALKVGILTALNCSEEGGSSPRRRRAVEGPYQLLNAY
jgi:hypothetical protein